MRDRVPLGAERALGVGRKPCEFGQGGPTDIRTQGLQARSIGASRDAGLPTLIALGSETPILSDVWGIIAFKS